VSGWWSEGDKGGGAHLGQFHRLGRGHFSDSRETGDIFTREGSGEERGLNDCRLISAVVCESDPRLILFSMQPIESIPGMVNEQALDPRLQTDYKR